MVKKILLLCLSLLLHLAAAAIFFRIIFLPIYEWYFPHYLLGVDFFLTTTIVSYLKKNLVFPFSGFIDFWWSGIPLTTILNPLQYYLIVPLTNYFTTIEAVKTYVLGTIFASGFFTYLVCQKLSKNHFVALVLSGLVMYSEGFFGAATWGGSLPYFATQMFLPLVTLILLFHLERKDKKFLLIGGLLLGLSYLAHPLPILAFGVPLAVLILLISPRKNQLSLKKRIVELITLGLISLLLGFPFSRNIMAVLRDMLARGGTSSSPYLAGATEKVVADFTRTRFGYLFSQVNNLMYPLIGLSAGVFGLAFVIGKKRTRGLLYVLPYLVFTLYVVGHVAANAYGYPFLGQAWYRAYWIFGFALAFLTASLVGASQTLVKQRLKLFTPFAYLFFAAAFVFLGFNAYRDGNQQKILDQVDLKSSPSSAYPEAWQLAKNESERESLKRRLVPAWLPVESKEYRLYESDAQVNIWWSWAYQLPMLRGYLDQPLATVRIGNIFMLDQALGNEGLVNNFDYEEETAKNIGLFYLDWYSIKYFEGGHTSISANVFPSRYLNDYIEKKEETKVEGLVRLYETPSGRAEVYPDVPQSLYFYKFKDEVTSPVVSATKAPVVLIISDEAGYDNFYRILSYGNINSKNLIPLWKSVYIDDFSKNELAQFNALFIYNYKYHNKSRAYKLLTDYVKEGGKLFIDSGFDGPESQSKELPELFPFREGEREPLGRQWDLTFSTQRIVKDLSSGDFGPPVYEDSPWKFSYPKGDLDEGASVILENQQKPILVYYQLGQGKVIWSGMNLAYHIVASEGKKKERSILLGIIEELVPSEKVFAITGEANFVNPQKVEFSVAQGRGILLRMQKYAGWEAKLNGQKAVIYKAGPAYPGFMYIFTKGAQAPYKASFTFSGSGNDKFNYLVVFLTLFFVIDYCFLASSVFGKGTKFIKNWLSRRVSRWWEKGEEE